MTKLQQYIKDQLNGGISSCRLDCYVCGGRNCLSISRMDGWIVYYCFRASCGIRGKVNDDLSIDALRNISSSTYYSSSSTSRQLSPSEKRVYEPPIHFTSPLQNSKCYSILRRYNLIDFYTKQPEVIRYDPKLDRLVFILRDYEGVIKGATGRSLSFDNIPRWYIYSRNDGCPFIPMGHVQGEAPCILVEDCISACVLYPYIFCIGLLGTAIPDECITYLLPFSRLYIALDDDATRKSLKLQKQLSVYKPTEIIPLKKDIKYFTKDELETLIKEL